MPEVWTSTYHRIRSRFLRQTRTKKKLPNRGESRREFFESLESRLMLASDWQNPRLPLDVSKDGLVVPLDALVIINELNVPTFERNHSLLPVHDPTSEPAAYLDTNGDAFLTPLDVLAVINGLNGDQDAPTITVVLGQDTAPDGQTNHDGVTSKSVLTGRVSDRRGVSVLSARVGDGPFETVSVDLDGNFSFDLELTSGVDDGVQVVEFIARDPGNVASPPVFFEFVFDTQPPQSATLDLSPTSDTGVVGDQETSASLVTLVGQSEPNVVVTLVGTDHRAIANHAGVFQFPHVALDDGENEFTFRVTDRAGNSADFQQVIQRLGDLPQDDVVLRWNLAALQAIQLDASTPPFATRVLAITSASVYDALMAFQSTSGIFTNFAASEEASPTAAAVGAAHRVLVSQFPAQKDLLDALLEETLADVPSGAPREQGLALGRAAADAILEIRAGDGWDRVVDYVPGTAPGMWQPTAPMFDVALLPQWGSMEPFAMLEPDQFRPPGPPGLGSPEWAADLNEVKDLGSANSTQRTADQTQIARFWADGRGTDTPPGHWNRIAADAARTVGSSLTVNARMLAELNMALADAAISTWDAKYYYDFWRPLTAIQNADSDGNPETTKDSEWVSLLVTPNFPEYTSGHSTFSGAGAAVLSRFFGDEFAFTTTSWSLPNVTRSYESFEQAAIEAGKSRIYGGIHYSFSSKHGLAAGQSIADWVGERMSLAHDETPPEIFVTAPLTTASLPASPRIQGRVHDLVSGVAALEVQFDGGEFTEVEIDELGNFDFLRTLDHGTHRVGLRARDAFGNLSAVRELSFSIDLHPPEITLQSPLQASVLEPGVKVRGVVEGTGSSIVALSYKLNDQRAMPLVIGADGGFEQSIDLSKLGPGSHTLRVVARDASGRESTVERTLQLEQAIPFRVSSVNPQEGSNNIGVTVHPQVYFTRPVNPASLTHDNFFATGPNGQKLPARIVPAADGSFAWLFFQSPMPGGSTITVSVVGDTILANSDGAPLDGDGDGDAGGTFQFRFRTVSTTSVPGTSIVGVVADPGPDLQAGTVDDLLGGPDGTLMTPDDIFKLPLANVKVYIYGQEDQAVFTDAAGRFELPSVPVGNVKIVVDGTTAMNPPDGIYFPEMVMDLYTQPGIANTVMSAMEPDPVRAREIKTPGVFLPRLRTSILTTIQGDQPNEIVIQPEAAPNLSAEQQALLKIEVQPGTFIGPDGQSLSSGQVGISTVPPEMVRDMLPPGVLQHTFDITVQAPGIANFTSPAPMTFPNVFNAAPGSKLNFLSFDHNTGRLVMEGTATVSADGKSATTDPGSGITHPGWHGLAPDGDDGCPFPDSPPVDDGEDDEESPDLEPVEYEEEVLWHMSDPPPPPPGLGEGETQPGQITGRTSAKNTESFRFEWMPPFKPKDPEKPKDEDKSDSADKCRAPEPPKKDDDEKESQERIEVEIQIEGDPEKWMKVSKGGAGDPIPSKPLTSAKYVLRPEEDPEKHKIVLAAEMKTLREMASALGGTPDFPLKALDENILFASRITIQYRHYNRDGKLDVEEKGYMTLYRMIDATDENHTDGTIKFEKSMIDGSVTRSKIIRVEGGPAPEMEVTGAAFSGGGSSEVKMDFKPTDAGQQSGELLIYSPSSPGPKKLVTKVRLQGEGVTKQKFDLNAADFAVSMVSSYLIGAVPANVKEAVFESSPGVLSPEKVSQFIQDVWANVQARLHDYASAIEFTMNSPGDAVRVNRYQFDILNDTRLDLSRIIFAHDLLNQGSDLGYTYGGGSDMAAIRDIREHFYDYSDAESYYRLAKAIHTSRTAEIVHDLGDFYKFADPANVYNSLVNMMGHNIAHEGGHGLGLPHTQSGSRGFDGGNRDIMAQGLDGKNERTFLLSGDAIPLGLGANWDENTAFKARNFFGQYVSAGGNFNSVDGNELVFHPPFEPGAGLLGLIDPENQILLPYVLFDAVDLGETKTFSYLLRNDGDKPTQVTSILVEGGNSQFTLGNLTFPFTLNPGESKPLELSFKPSVNGEQRSQLVIRSDSLQPELRIRMEGFGETDGGVLKIDRLNNNLGGVRVGLSSIREVVAALTNEGRDPLTITNIRITEPGTGFTLRGIPENLGTEPFVLEPGQTLNLGAGFVPQKGGLQRAFVEVTTDDVLQPVRKFVLVGTGLSSAFTAVWGNDFVAVEAPEIPNAPVLRTISSSSGQFNFFLASNTYFHTAIFDPGSGLIGHDYGVTGPSGVDVYLNSNMYFQASIDADSDGDGLPDDIEFAIGTRADSTDSDEDGIDDFVEIEQQLDPIGGRRLPVGVLSALELQGRAEDLVLTGSLADPTQQTAFVATGNYGLAVVDASLPTQPAILSEIELPGNNVDVAYDANRNLAIVAGGPAGVHYVDVSDRFAPTLQQTVALPLGATEVEIFADRIYVATKGALTEVDGLTGEVLQSLPIGDIQDMTISGSLLYAIIGDKLQVVDLGGFEMETRGSVTLPHVGQSLFVAGGIAFVTRPAVVLAQSTGGYSTIDVSNPDQLDVISGPDNPGRNPGHDIVLDGSGLALIGDFIEANSQGVVDLLSVSDPEDTDTFFTRFTLPAAIGGLAIASGMGFVANAEAGFVVINFRDFDIQGQPPTVTVRPLISDADPQAAGMQVFDSSLVPLEIITTDDVQVRNVELLLDGQVVGNDVSYPFEFVLGMPPRTAEKTRVTFQARVTDTGGNRSVSDLFDWELIPDTFPPQIVSSTPAEGANVFLVPTITVNFNESLDPSRLTLAGMSLTYFGADGQLGGDDDEIIPIGKFELRNQQRTVVLVPGVLLDNEGSYQLRFESSAITDRVGNQPANPITRQFTLRAASDVRALRGTPALPRIPSANAGQLIGFKVPNPGFDAEMTFPTRNETNGTLGTRKVFVERVEDGKVFFRVPSDATTGEVSISTDPNGPFPLQIVPAIDRAEDGGSANDRIVFDRLRLIGSGFQEAAMTILVGSQTIVDDNGQTDQFPNVEADFPGHRLLLPLSADEVLGPIVVVTEGGSSNPLFDEARITGIVATAQSGTPAASDKASANPGQAIVIQGVGLHANVLVAFQTVNIGGGEFWRFIRPVAVNPAGTEAVVIVPPNALTGKVRILGDVTGSSAALQIVPVIETVDFQRVEGTIGTNSSIVVRLIGRNGIIEDHGTIYRLGDSEVVDDGSAGTPDAFAFFADPANVHIDVRFSLEVDFHGALTITTAGGTSAPFNVQFDSLEATAFRGTPANPDLASANPGQVITVLGAHFTTDTDFLGQYTDNNGNRRFQILNPSFVSADGTMANITVPAHFNNAYTLHLLGTSAAPVLQIVPVLDSFDVTNLDTVQLRGRGFVEGNDSLYQFATNSVTDTSTGASGIDVVTSGSENGGVNVSLPQTAAGDVRVTTAGGTSNGLRLHFANPDIGALGDIATGSWFVSAGNRIHRINETTGVSELDFAIPGGGGGSLIGLQELPIAMTLNGTSVPAGSLLVFNGNPNPDQVFALNPANGAVLASLQLVEQANENLDLVAGVFHPGTGHLFGLDGNPDEVLEIDPASGAVLNRYSLNANILSGGLAVHPTSGNLWISSDRHRLLIEITPAGELVREIVLSDANSEQEFSGIAFGADGSLIASSVAGVIYRFDLEPESKPAPKLTSIEAVAASGTPADPQQASANTGQTIVLVGEDFTATTQVLVPTRDQNGLVTTVVVMPTLVNDAGTRMQVRLPDLAQSGPISLAVGNTSSQLGFNANQADTIYRSMRVRFTATDNAAEIHFTDGGLQNDLNDESWGLDNVRLVPVNSPNNPVFEDDFESGGSPLWALSATDQSLPGIFTRFSGRFGNIGQAITLPVTAGQEYELEFDLYILDSWDGTTGGNAGPDYFSVLVDGHRFFHEAFSNMASSFQTFGHIPSDSVHLQIVPTLTAISGKVGGDITQVQLQGSGFMEGAMSVTIGGFTFVDDINAETFNNGNVLGNRNGEYNFSISRSLEGPVTITTAGGSATIAVPLPSPVFVDLVGIESVAQFGTPASIAVASANVGQEIVLTGRGLSNSTAVIFEAVDETGASGTVMVTGQANTTGTQLRVKVPLLARTGSVRVAGDSVTAVPLQIVPHLRSVGGAVQPGQTLVLEGTGIVSGEVAISIGGTPATLGELQHVFGAVNATLPLRQQLLDVIVPAGGADGEIKITTQGGSFTFPKSLALTNLPDVSPPSDVGDTLATAATVNLPAFSTVVLSSEIGDISAANRDVDLYVISAKAGDRITVTPESVPGSNLNLVLKLFDSQGAQLAVREVFEDSGIDDIQLPNDGLYYIGISNTVTYQPTVSGSSEFGFTTGEYRVRVDRVGPGSLRLTGIQATLETGQPRVAGVAAANVGQEITLLGSGLRPSDSVLFTIDGPGLDGSGMFAVQPISVAPDGSSLVVRVPSSALTGLVRLSRDGAGVLLQVVPRLTNVGRDQFGDTSIEIIGSGFPSSGIVVEVGGRLFDDRFMDSGLIVFLGEINLTAEINDYSSVGVRTVGGFSGFSTNTISELVASATKGTAENAAIPSANPGQTITIRGTGFHAATGVVFPVRNVGGGTSVRFVRPVSVVSPTEITVVVPADATTGDVTLIGEAGGTSLPLQIIPIINRVDITSISGDRLVVMIEGNSFVEGDDSIYRFGNYTRYDTGTSNNFQGIDIRTFGGSVMNVDVPLTFDADIFGPISITVPGGTATYAPVINSFSSTALTGTPANPAVPSANPGQPATLEGSSLSQTLEILFLYTDAAGSPKWAAVNPTSAAEDGTSVTFNIPTFVNGIVQMRVLGSSFQQAVQIVPTVTRLEVINANDIRIHGNGFLEGNNTVYNLNGTAITDLEVSDGLVQVVDTGSSGNNLVQINPPAFGLGNLVVTTIGGTSAPIAYEIFNPELGRLLDVAGGDLYVVNASTIQRVDPATGGSLSSFELPGSATSNTTGLHLLTAAIPSFGGTPVPAGSLLIFNGATNPEKVFAVNPADGSSIAELTIAENLNAVAGVYHAGTNRLFLLDDNPNEVVRVNPETGEIVTTFATPFDIAFGGLAVDPVTANLWIGSSQSAEVAEVTPAGVLVRRVNLSSLGVDSGEITGLAFDSNGKLLVSTVHGFVHRITLPGAALRLAGAGENASALPAAALQDADESLVASIFGEAIRRWSTAGIPDDQLAAISQTRVIVMELAGDYLGFATPDYIAIDSDAAGAGWYLDGTPWDDDEFLDSLAAKETGGVDLLSVLSHEIGHLLGFEHDLDVDSLFNDSLSAGERKW